jgi:NDP-sugar pyrophosphorylase family protein
MKDVDITCAVLQAGGRGRRLLPFTDSIPKPLIKVGGIPMVERLMMHLLDVGIRELYIITGWLGEKVEAHINNMKDLPPDLSVHFIHEDQPLGNIGAMALLPRQPGPILFSFADLVTDINFKKLVVIHQQLGSDITLTSHYEAHQLTLGELSVSGEIVRGYQEKPIKQFLICSGIAVFEPYVLDLINPSCPTGISDLISAALTASLKVSHWTHNSFWADVNTPEILQYVNIELEKRE